MEKKTVRYKWMLYALLMFISLILETTLLSHIKIFGATPTHLLPYAVAVIAMLEGTTSGALAGLFAGVMSDALLPAADGFYTITFVFCGILISFLCNFVFWKSFWTTLLYLAAAMLVTRILYYIFFFVIFGKGEVLSLFFTLPAEFLATAIFAPVIYFLVIKIAKWAGLGEEA
ncbi:MAG: hypothetical protein IKU84_07205 [Clostridia bacterium]|nr:hypothetical protein [Clostridia bacterium]